MGKGIFNYYNSLKEITTTDLISSELLKKTLWKTLYPVIIVDARNYEIQFANEASEILFGSPFQNSHPTNLKAIVKSASDLKKIKPLVELGLETDNLHLKVVTVNNKEIDTIVKLQFISEAGINYTVIHFKNMNNSGKESILFKENHLLKNLVNEQTVLFACVDKEGNFLFLNDFYYDMFNIHPDKLIGENFISFVLPEYRETAQKEFQKVLHPPYEANFDLPCNTVKGIKTFHCNVKSVVNENGEAEYVIGSAHDHTEIVKKEKYLTRINSELDSLNKLKDKVFSEVSHDLKGPIGNLQAAMKIMLEMKNSLSEDEFDVFLVNMEKSLAKLFKLLNELTEWSEIELGKVNPKIEEVGLAHLIYEALGILRGAILDKKLQTNVEVYSSLNIKCDRTLIGVVLTHVLENSIDYSDPEGTIDLEIEIKEGQVQLKITDYGSGMNKEKVDILNQIETKQSAELWSNLKCAPCLDVVICRAIMKMHGSTIQFSSQPGKGTTVYLNFADA